MNWETIERKIKPSREQRKRLLVSLRNLNWEQTGRLSPEAAYQIIQHLAAIEELIEVGSQTAEQRIVKRYFEKGRK